MNRESNPPIRLPMVPEGEAIRHGQFDVVPGAPRGEASRARQAGLSAALGISRTGNQWDSKEKGMSNKSKLITGSILGIVFFTASAVFSQTVPPTTAMPQTDNIASAMFYQVLNNPASLLVIGFLCIVAWLVDDLPFINSRYVAHATVIVGASIYWLFAPTSSVATLYPYPFAVLVVNGTICGFIAFVFHRQAIARFINFLRVRSGNDGFVEKSTQLKPPSTDTAFTNKPIEK